MVKLINMDTKWKIYKDYTENNLWKCTNFGRTYTYSSEGDCPCCCECENEGEGMRHRIRLTLVLVGPGRQVGSPELM